MLKLEDDAINGRVRNGKTKRRLRRDEGGGGNPTPLEDSQNSEVTFKKTLARRMPILEDMGSGNNGVEAELEIRRRKKVIIGSSDTESEGNEEADSVYFEHNGDVDTAKEHEDSNSSTDEDGYNSSDKLAETTIKRMPISEDMGFSNHGVKAGLETRQRKKVIIGSSDTENFSEENKEGDSVYFDHNGDVDIAKEHEDSNSTTDVDCYNSSDKITENGLGSLRITKNNDSQIEEAERQVVDYDVERVIAEQETHHLQCPICHTYITKRVILRKRKRGPRQNSTDSPPGEPHVTASQFTPVEDKNIDGDEGAFTCLSCFSIFVPAGGVFWKRKENVNLTNSDIVSTNKTNCISFLFGSNSRTIQDNGADKGVIPTGPNAKQPSLDEDYNLKSPNNTPLQDNYKIPNGFIPKQHVLDVGGGLKLSISTNQLPDQYKISNGSTSKLEHDDGSELSIPTHEPSDKYGVSNGATAKQRVVENDDGLKLPPSIHQPPDDTLSQPLLLEHHINGNPDIHTPEVPAHADLELGVQVVATRARHEWDIMKSIVYGGLIESITSLGVVSSAAGAGSSTLKICALGMANLISGLFLVSHHLSELKRDTNDVETADQNQSQYYKKLGKRENFKRHAFFSILSFIIFGLVPPVVYGFAFRATDNKENKIIAVAISTCLCIAILALGKAHVNPQKGYFRSLFYYIGIALPVSGLGYVAGVMLERLLEEFTV